MPLYELPLRKRTGYKTPTTQASYTISSGKLAQMRLKVNVPSGNKPSHFTADSNLYNI
jgi:hypothetical protein